MTRCKDCIYWTRYYSRNLNPPWTPLLNLMRFGVGHERYTRGGTPALTQALKRYGQCSHEAMDWALEPDHSTPANQMLAFEPDWNKILIATGEDFGCVHGEPREIGG